MSTPATPLPVEIDFDAASAAWHANKIRRGPRLYYRCTATNITTGKPCPRIANVAALDSDPSAPHLCTQHQRSTQRSPK